MNTFLFYCLFVTSTALPDSLRPNDAAVTLDAVDRDFEFQGEYLGGGSPLIGLQVVALGDGQFSARQFFGGLPGGGADRGRVTTLSGSRKDDVVTLSGEHGEYATVRGNTARFAFRRDAYSVTLREIERKGPTLGLKPPQGAHVIFAENDPTARLEAVNLAADGTLLAGATTKDAVRDFHLHLEFRTPYMPHARGQGRGNSGVYIQRRYEVQILDSFGLPGEDNECGGLYKQRAPDVNMCLPPLAWQTYDIHFTAARWDQRGRKIQEARITVFHNGVAVHYRQPVSDKTGAGQAEGPQPLPIHFQDHGNPVTFRNIWIDYEDVARGGPRQSASTYSRRIFRRCR